MKGRELGQRGSAIIISIVVGMVLMVMTLSMLFAAYSLFQNVNDDTLAITKKELANSALDTLQGQLTVKFDSKEALEEAKYSGKYELYFFIADKLGEDAFFDETFRFRLKGTEKTGYFVDTVIFCQLEDEERLLNVDIELKDDKEVIYRATRRYSQKYENGIWSFERYD